MKTKIKVIPFALSLVFALTACNPSVPSSSNSMIGLLGEVLRSAKSAIAGESTTTSGTATTTGTTTTTPTVTVSSACNWDNVNWDACNWE